MAELNLTKEERALMNKIKQRAGLVAISDAKKVQEEQLKAQAEVLKADAPEGDKKSEEIAKRDAAIVTLQEEQKTLLKFLEKPDGLNIDIRETEEKPIRKNPFKSLGHMAADLMTEGLEKVESEELKIWRSEVKATQTVGAPETGGTLVPTEYVATALDRQRAINPVLSRATIIPMAYDKVVIPFLNGFDESQGKVFGNGQFYWEGEEEAFTESNFETGAVELNLKQAIGAVKVSRNLLKFSAVSIESLIQRVFDQGMSTAITKAAIRGTGAKQPKGVLTSGDHKVTVPKATNQIVNTFILDNVADMVARLYSGDDDIGAGSWFSNRTVLPQLIKLSLAVGTGGSGVFLTNQDVKGKPTYSLLGIPLSWSSQMSIVGDVGDICLFDWSQYLVGQPAGRPGAETETSIHLYFNTAHTSFRIIFDMDGQPWWPENFKPARGDTQAPFIELAARD